MRVLVDTSAILALLLDSDAAHERAKSAFSDLRRRRAALVTTSYVLVETYSLLGRRVGLDALRAFRSGFAPLLEVVWIDRERHEQALDLLEARSERTLSLVDAASFVVAREQRLTAAFAFDAHFETEGFELVG